MRIISGAIGLLFFLLGGPGVEFGLAADFSVSNIGISAYRINGATNPTLTLLRGQTYSFSIAALNHPFWIKTNAVTGTGSAYTNGVTGNGTDDGTLTFAVPLTAPNSLRYICQIHSSMTGTLNITNPPPVAAQLSNARWSAPGEFSFDVAGTIGRLHVTEVTTNFTNGWFALGSNSPPDGVFTFKDTNAGMSDLKFYRVNTK